ncbi:MAG: CoA transferase [Nocardioides sp.]
MADDRPRWWPGPFDVEAFATSAVEAVRGAVAECAPGREVSTTPSLVASAFAAVDHLRIDGRAPQAWAPMSGFVRATDGWIRTHANFPHHAAAITRALGATTGDELDAKVAALTAAEAADRIVAAGGIATVVRSEREWGAHPHALATAGDAWVTQETTGSRPAVPTGDGLPLAGVRVLDLTRVLAGPTCTQLLACLGAEVLRIDAPARPELLDQYISNAMGKRSAELDLADSCDLVRDGLVPRADVVILGYRPRSLARFGLTPAQLIEHRPGLVVGSLSAWGEHGPWAERPGFDSIVQAASGIAERCAADGRPGALPVQALDYATGCELAAHVIGMLARGEAGVVRASLLGAARTLLGRPAPSDGPVGSPRAHTVEVPSPYGPVVAVPPPILLDGETLERSISGYAASAPAWR